MEQNWKKKFVIIYIGQAFSILGSAAAQFAIIWWLTVQTESAITLTTATIIGFIPNMVLGPFAGVLIDRYNRKTVMIAADALVALASAFLGVVFWFTPVPPIWLIYVILFVRGLGATFHMPAMQAAIPTLVPVEKLTQAGGWGQTILSVSNMAGPVLGAALMAGNAVAPILLIDVAGAVFAIVCLLFVAIPDLPKSARAPHLFADMRAGLDALRGNKPLVALFPAMMLVNITFMPLGALYPLLIRTHFNGGAWHNGVAEFVFAAGLLISSLAIGIWGGMKRRFLMISLSILLLGITSTVSGILPPSAFWVFGVMCFFMGMTGTFFNVPMMAYVQETVEPDQMGKVVSLLMTAATWAMPVGLLLAGPLSQVIGVDQWFFYSGLVLALAAVLCHLQTKRFDRPGMGLGKTSFNVD